MQTAKRILLVEDDVDDQQLFCEALNEIHPTIVCQIANNGAEAMLLVDEPPPYDIIFLDLNMPKIDGFECLRRLKENPKFNHIPVVVVSTSSRTEDIERCKQLGAATFFTKPPLFEDLFLNLNNIIKSRLMT